LAEISAWPLPRKSELGMGWEAIQRKSRRLWPDGNTTPRKRQHL
jgi:hypothetical protein